MGAEFGAVGTCAHRSAEHANAPCFSDMTGISEVALDWGLSLEKEGRKAGWLQNGEEHPRSAVSRPYSWTGTVMSPDGSVGGAVGGGSHTVAVWPASCGGDCGAGRQQQIGPQHPPPQQQHHWGRGSEAARPVRARVPERGFPLCFCHLWVGSALGS